MHFRDATAPAGMRLYAIGDVHGRFDLLFNMHARIEAELERDRPDDFRIVHVGDYVDRGPQSREVIDFLVERTRDPRIVALAGNHDVGFLDFLARPSADSLFVGNGGVQTAQSYGLDPDFGSDTAIRAASNALLALVPRTHLAFLGALPRSANFGDFFFCHAGVRPGIALDRQSEDDLIWIRKAFLEHAGLYEKIVVHGHTPQAEPEILPNRVNIDTAAFKSGVLTALAVDGRQKRILQVG